MKTAWPLCVWAILMVAVESAPAESTLTTITVPDVLVRSGPSPEFYPTSRLRRGDKVRVVREEATGWLAIEPPHGSFSYIEARLVEWISRNAAVVSAPEAQIWVGSELVHSKPTVWRTKVKRGTQVSVTGKIQQTAYDTWLSILPVPSEVRYIPAEAVRLGAAPQEFAGVSPEPSKTSPTPAAFALPDKGAAAFTAVQPPLSVHPALAPVRRSDGWTAPPPGPATAANPNIAGANSRLPAAPSASSAAIASPRVPSEYCYLPDSRYTARLSTPITTPQSPLPSGQWYEPGWLSRTAFPLDGRPLFCLQPLAPNKRHIYVSPGPNVNLEPYVNRKVYLYGTLVYNGDLRTYYMTVLQVQLAR
jgi:hypothetical protein